MEQQSKYAQNRGKKKTDGMGRYDESYSLGRTNIGISIDLPACNAGGSAREIRCNTDFRSR
jgi:hypothetical protein